MMNIIASHFLDFSQRLEKDPSEYFFYSLPTIKDIFSNQRQTEGPFHKTKEIFPKEMVEHVLSFLDVEDLLQCKVVNKEWKSLCIKRIYILKEKQRQKRSSEQQSGFFAKIFNSLPFVSSCVPQPIPQPDNFVYDASRGMWIKSSVLNNLNSQPQLPVQLQVQLPPPVLVTNPLPSPPPMTPGINLLMVK